MPTLVRRTERTVTKQFRPSPAEPRRALEERLFREVSAYMRFRALGASFVPGLVRCDIPSLTLETVRAPGRDLRRLLELEVVFDVEWVTDQLLNIDSFLFRHRMDVQFLDLGDIIIDVEEAHVCIVDFEFTAVDRPFSTFVLEISRSKKFDRLADRRLARELRSTFTRRRREAHRYWLRRSLNPILRRTSSRRLRRSKLAKDLVNAKGSHYE